MGDCLVSRLAHFPAQKSETAKAEVVSHCNGVRPVIGFTSGQPRQSLFENLFPFIVAILWPILSVNEGQMLRSGASRLA